MQLYLIMDGGNGASLDKEAYGSFIVRNHDKNGALLLQKRITLGTGYTNNEAEYLTLINSLETIKAMLGTGLALSVTNISLIIEGDSELVRCQVGTYTKGLDMLAWKGWKVNVPHLRPLRDKARQLLEKFDSFTYNHIPRKEVVSVLGH